MYDEIPVYRYRLIDYVGDGFVLGASFGSPFYWDSAIRPAVDA